ncbi:MAG: PqqD family peptide modification chaperone [Nitrososphaerota archaeon]
MDKSRKLSKKGWINQTPEGELLLVNENGVAYRVNESIIVVWDAFNDKTVDEVVVEIASQIDKDPEELREPIEQLAEALLEAELLA